MHVTEPLSVVRHTYVRRATPFSYLNQLSPTAEWLLLYLKLSGMKAQGGTCQYYHKRLATHLHCSPGQLPPPSYQLLITICGSILRLVAENRHHGHHQHHCSDLAVTQVDTLQ